MQFLLHVEIELHKPLLHPHGCRSGYVDVGVVCVIQFQHVMDTPFMIDHLYV